MEAITIKILELIWDKSDPLLVICIIILGYWQMKTSRKLTIHLDPQNRYPHPSCEWGEKNYDLLCKELTKQHKENREDHQTIFEKIDGLREHT